MPDAKDPNVWELVFTQTPPTLRWALGILTLGIFTLASVLYRWHRADMAEMHRRMDRMEALANERHIETNRWLFEIAKNTRRQS